MGKVREPPGSVSPSLGGQTRRVGHIFTAPRARASYVVGGINASCWAHLFTAASASPSPRPTAPALTESPRSAAAFCVFGPRRPPAPFAFRRFRPHVPPAPAASVDPERAFRFSAPKRAQRLVCGHGQSVARSGGSPGGTTMLGSSGPGRGREGTAGAADDLRRRFSRARAAQLGRAAGRGQL
jgi:hypothetical protein